MIGQQQKTAETTPSDSGRAGPSPPAITLPKGGGAIRGIGDKFAANPVTGTGSLSVPIYTSPGRSGFGPQLSLSYDSGAGNGPFGFGWNLSLPSITRKTDKGLPRYEDADESDVFILSGAEDLVPVLQPDGSRFEDQTTAPGYTIHRYRPRVEGLFARIERWTNRATGEIHWRSISKDNITTWCGKTAESRIADPADPTRVFSWLICQSYDDKGNAIVYEYAAENSHGINLAQAHERNRTDKTRSANRYLKRIKYGNRSPNRDTATWKATDPTQIADWMFEVVLDYDEGHYGEIDLDAERPEEEQHRFVRASAGPRRDWDDPERPWTPRPDPFSSCRAGFEVRTYRRCSRVLMFHHISDLPTGEQGYDGLVRSTEFSYSASPVASFITSITQSGYVRQPAQGQPDRHLERSLPPLELEYSQVPGPEQLTQLPVHTVDAESLENLPYGLDGASYQWVDLDGEGVSGILTEQAGSWFYKRNLSPVNIKRDNSRETVLAKFASVELVAQRPSLANVSGGQQQFLDLAGDGQIDLVQFAQPLSGYYERTQDEGWSRFVPFESVPNLTWDDPNLKFVDLTGDGHADILITEDQVFTWHLSLAEAGFGPAEEVCQALDEEAGPRLVFADGTQSIYLADLSGDGLTDLARVRNGEICYWPSLGYGRFGAKVTMDDAPWFDHPDQFDHKRVHLADIDGSGTTDIIYLGRDGVDLYFNQAGNSWSKAQTLTQFPRTDNLSSVMAVDLLGNGTACLVWSSPLPGDAEQPMRYLDLMGGQKPHLLIKLVNNLGAETHVHYAPSTRFYLADKEAGKPWITKLPFPVHVVERVVTYDRISRNRFVTRYTYHHGYFDGVEREFRGFGMVEQRDTEEYATLEADALLDDADNLDEASHVPPVVTRTWFHTGAYLQGGRISRLYETDYYREGDESRGESGLSEEHARSLLLADTLLHPGLSVGEEREACRALRGSILRQEIYAEDKTDKADRPYSVSERNYTVKTLQPRGENRYAVFFSHTREVIDFHYERKLVQDGDRLLADPRVSHQMTLAVDAFGNVERSVAIGYRRRDLPGTAEPEQQRTHITLTVNRFANAPDQADWYRVGLSAETRTYEIVKPPEPGTLNAIVLPFGFEEMDVLTEGLFPSDIVEPEDEKIWPYAKWDWHTNPANAPNETRLRLIEHIRTYYRRDDLDDEQGPLALTQVRSLALPYETYKLAFTPGLLAGVYGGRVEDSMLADEGGYVHSEGDANWWIPSGRVFYSEDPSHSPDRELEYARTHFFLPHRYRDPFHSDQVSTETFVNYDAYDLLMHETRDALDNRVTVGERDVEPTQPLVRHGQDYRVLQPKLIMDPNRNRSAVAFDALGMVVGTAVMGKPEEDPRPGDSLDKFDSNPPDDTILVHISYPLGKQNPPPPLDPVDPHEILQKGTTRLIYDLFAYYRTRDHEQPQPAVVYTMARETHNSDLAEGEKTKIQHSFSCSDGFGREIQKKIQAESGPGPKRDAEGKIVVGEDNLPEMTNYDIDPRWVGSGWTVFNNKGKPVRQYEPFFTDRHGFEFDVRIGVRPILFYDPPGRVVATLHPNHTYEKIVFDPWQQTTYDVNDTLHPTESYDPRSPNDLPDHTVNPADDPDVADYFGRLPQDEYLPTWYDLRMDTAKASERWPDVDPSTGAAIRENAAIRAAQKSAAEKAAKHAATPTVAFLDVLGRTFITVADNGLTPDGTPRTYPTRVELDIEGNQRKVRDERKNDQDILEQRIVMHYDYSIVGPEQDESGKPTNANLIHQASVEAGERWMLNDVTGKPIRAWDSRGHSFRTDYDPLRRPLRIYVTSADGDNPNREPLTERLVYGEQHPEAEQRNLRSQLYLHLDQAGAAITEARDFKGNPLRTARRIAVEYKRTIDWSATDGVLPANATVPFDPAALEAALAPSLQADPYTSRTTYDALNRPVTLTTPHTPAMQPSVIRPSYNEANLLERVDTNLRRAIANGQPVWTPFVVNVDYNAKGQRELIDYGNGARTTYEYDPLTFRLVHLLTQRNAIAFPDDCLHPPPSDWPGCQVQNLHYTYDPVGNITRIRDDAQQTIFFNNQRIEPSADYIYDAVYRLIKATGREHIGQVGESVPPSWDDKWRVNIAHPCDGQAMRGYTERYEYDQVGNILKMIHAAANGDWTRQYTYEETSLIEPTKQSNRLSRTTVGNGTASTEEYSHDAHGNMTRMNHLPLIQWDYRDQLQATSRKAVSGGGTPETTYYVYDAAGQRVRKVTEGAVSAFRALLGAKPNRKTERIYVGGFEIYREYNGATGAVDLERETLHIMDDKQRIALIETRTRGNDGGPSQLVRYQFCNHLGSASLELDDNAQIMSYEEYTPYGSTSYQAVRSQTETPKRYRYTGKERDEGTGFYCYGTRFYASWLIRWISPDPAGLVDSTCLYAFVRSNPLNLRDPSGNQAHEDEPLEPLILQIPRDPKDDSWILPLLETEEQGGPEAFDPGNAFEKSALNAFPMVLLEAFFLVSGMTLLSLSGPPEENPEVARTHELMGQLRDAFRIIEYEPHEEQHGKPMEILWTIFFTGVAGAAIETAAVNASRAAQARRLVSLAHAEARAISTKGATSYLTNAQRGPVLTAVMDTETGNLFYGTNIASKQFADRIAEIHPLLMREARSYVEITKLSGGQLAARFGTPGSHSEITALSRALRAAEARQGTPLLTIPRGRFLIHNVTLRGSRSAIGVPPRCPPCATITGKNVLRTSPLVRSER